MIHVTSCIVNKVPKIWWVCSNERCKTCSLTIPKYWRFSFFLISFFILYFVTLSHRGWRRPTLMIFYRSTSTSVKQDLISSQSTFVPWIIDVKICAQYVPNDTCSVQLDCFICRNYCDFFFLHVLNITFEKTDFELQIVWFKHLLVCFSLEGKFGLGCMLHAHKLHCGRRGDLPISFSDSLNFICVFLWVVFTNFEFFLHIVYFFNQLVFWSAKISQKRTKVYNLLLKSTSLPRECHQRWSTQCNNKNIKTKNKFDKKILVIFFWLLPSTAFATANEHGRFGNCFMCKHLALE